VNVLAIVAHPDDEVIGCGATLAKLAERGHEVKVLLPLRRGDPRGITHWEALTEAFVRSCTLLGAVPIIADPLVAERALEAEFNRMCDILLGPVEWADTIFTHWPEDVNQVHRVLARAVEVAVRPFRRRREVYLFEVPTSTEQGFRPSFVPNSYCLLDAHHAQRKCEAMSYYLSEHEPGRSPKSLHRRMQVRGEEAGGDFAEAFYLAHHFF